MKVIAWVVLLISLVLTAAYVANGLTSADELPWLNGWMAGPMLLISAVPTLFSVARMTSGMSLTGGVHRTFHGAPIGIGRVVGVTRTGLTVNDQPQLDIRLEIDTPDGHVLAGTARQLVDLTDLAVVRVGATLPVRYLPDGRAALATDASPGELQAALDQVQLAQGLVTPQQLHISRAGVDAQAVVLAMVPTGEVRHDRSMVTLTLRVTRPDRAMFDVTQQKALPAGAIGQLQPGAVVRVKYLPHDESEVVVLTQYAP
ncbi:hypothetical protein ABZ816_01560 [Actinosynnema sp. NPDC047251]|uniref:Putative secreted protein n=1 Tax=Saccharothrix espanaensis (strain ATCC 51144 / DSM 44229 / JCM 9112 / NBRC 15066 / NRRL 15764) TaxID=1179773 RepID=K0K2Z0_SACES|nr:hypothetical protein [Saccharothrix espanaensis]CCH30938.1 putative secreted protein [Saccharothrix espanaensis DSM 44229]